MLASENERLTRVGSGTPMGNLMRRYWQPIAAVDQLQGKSVMPIRILGEDLVVFRDKQGKLGLVANRCAHRLVELQYGYVVDEGLRCPYHGWTYDTTGQCTAQPAEAPGSTFKDKIKLTSYPVQELCGLLFAYLGPEPVPLLPRWEPLVKENVLRQISIATLACNWLQVAENFYDLTHAEFAHGHSAKDYYERKGTTPDDPYYQMSLMFTRFALEGQAFEPYEYGVIRKMRLSLKDKTATSAPSYEEGFPTVFPNAQLVPFGGSFSLHWAVPVDDTTTIQLVMRCIDGGDVQLAPQNLIPSFVLPLRDTQGEWNLDVFLTQDHQKMVGQGPIMDRTQEHLAPSDKGVIHLRRLLSEQIEVVEKGGSPMNFFLDPAKNVCLKLPGAKSSFSPGRYMKGTATHPWGGVGYGPLSSRFEEIAQKHYEPRAASTA